jgi:hypothetical protein
MALAGQGRRRSRRHPIMALVLVGIGLAWLLSLGLAYRVGSSQETARVAQLTSELELQGQLVRDLSRRAARAEQNLTRAEAELEPQRAARRAGRPDLVGPQHGMLARLIEEKLASGIPADHIRAAVETLSTAARCGDMQEVRQFLARTPVTRDPSTARFEGGKILVRGTGVSARNVNGLPEAWFDVGAPVELRIELDGSVTTASGLLPLRHIVRRAEGEYRFEARPHARRGFIEVALTVCESA